MESIESRSDTRSLLLEASPDQVLAAIDDPARIARWGHIDDSEHRL
jgi:hypothetical protein